MKRSCLSRFGFVVFSLLLLSQVFGSISLGEVSDASVCHMRFDRMGRPLPFEAGDPHCYFAGISRTPGSDSSSNTDAKYENTATCPNCVDRVGRFQSAEIK
jgi:hypothetical protein